MSRTLVALYDRPETACQVVEDLVRAGCDRRDISSVAPARAARMATSELAGQDYTHIDGVGDVRARGPLRDHIHGRHQAGHLAGGLVETLVAWGIPQLDAERCAAGLRHGDSLVVARVPDDVTPAATQVMRRDQPM